MAAGEKEEENAFGRISFSFLKKKKAASGREGQVDIKYMERWGDAIVA
jgi:hypothetical protein